MRRGVKKIRRLVITEIAAVDRPANEHALMHLTKRHDTEEEQQPMPEQPSYEFRSKHEAQAVTKSDGMSQGEALDGAYAALEEASREYMGFAVQRVTSQNPMWEPNRILEVAKAQAMELAMRQRPELYAAYSNAHHAEQFRLNQRSGHRREL